MAGLPTPKSREQILSEMLTEYVGLTGINDLNTGSVITQFFDVVARSVARTSGDIFQILRDFSVERATGEALNRIGREERVYRNTAQVATGKVKVTDTSFQKISTKIYSGASAPNIGSAIIKVSDASSFPSSGRIYIGRGTPNIEGPINFSAVTQVGAFWEITLDSPTTKFHNISESVILGQGGTRNIPVNTVVLSPGAGATPAVNYNVSSAALLLDGENVNTNVQVTAQEPGSLGNAPAGAVTQFASPPFPNAAVINTTPFTTGADEESDDDYRDRIKKERLSRGLGTALAVKNAVLGAQAPDENARVTSNEIDTTNPEQTILYIDNGEGYEEKTEGVGLEYVVDSAIGGEQNFQLQTGGRQTSVAKAFLESSISAPYDIRSLDKLAILVGGVISEHIFPEGAFKAQGAATAFEVVSSINDNPNLTFEATTSESGTKVVIRAKAEDDEFLQLTSPTTGTDAGPKLGFPSNEIATVLLYKNRELLNKNGRSAFVITKNQFDWSTSITNNDTLIISVDGTDFITYTFKNEDFISEGNYTTVSSQNSLESWANVINKKVTGVTAEVNGEQLKLTSNLGPKNRASIIIDVSSDLVAKGMFSSQLGLSSQGNEADFQLSRNTAQIKLNTPLTEGDSLNLGSEFTRAEIQSNVILGGQTTLSDTAYIWFVVDDPNVTPVEVGVTADTFINVLKPGGGIVRYESTSVSAFNNVQIGDYVIIWSPDLSATNRLEGRVHAKTSTTLDLKVTTTEETAAVAEGPIFFTEGFTVLRTEYTPQKIKIDAGVYNINDIAIIIDEQLDNGTATVENDEYFVFRTNTEATNGAFFIADFNDPAKAMNLVKNSFSQSINSQAAFYETGFSDKQFPAFVHGKVTADSNADPIDSYINTVQSSENLANLGLDPSGWICFDQPYGGPNDVQSTECVEIEKYIGTTINVENSYFYKRSRINDRYHVLNPYDFGHEDSLVAVLDDDPTAKTFNMPLYRTAVTNITLPSNANNFRAYDQEGGDVEFTQFFGTDFKFDNYKALMQAKNVIDPLSAVNDDAILYRSTEWGRSGEKFGIGYFYPTSPDQGISHIVTVTEDVDIKIFLKSGPVRTTTIDGTTEWNVSISPLSLTVDLVTYAWSGNGTDPGLASINSGDYVSIITTGEFSTANQGAYRVDSATATSFTIRRATGEAETQSDVATLEVNTLSFFEPADTTAQEIVDYVTTNISNYITATIIQDGTTAIDGSGIINRSTGEDANFDYKFVRLKDGKNYILSSNISASIVNPQFVFKTPLILPSFDTNTTDAYSFNNGEEIKLIPTTSLQVTEFFNVLAVTGFSTLGQIKSIERNSNVQLSTDILGTNGAVQIAGGTGGSASASIEGSASTLGSQDNQKSNVSILTATSIGFHSDQWVKVFASERQKKITGINALNSIEISTGTPVVGFSKIEIFNRDTQQRFFGRNRYHTRTRGRTFKVEKHGQFTCFSWDENGTQPYFLKTDVDVKDSSASTLTIYKDALRGTVDISVDTGDMRFDEVAIGDIVTFANRVNDVNNGSYKVIGISSNAKTIRIQNPSAINELVEGSFTITDNVAVLGTTFEVGGINIVEGVDFTAGVDTIETASNLSAAISLLPNIVSTSSGSTANISSEVPGVAITLSITGGGATASGTDLVAPISNTGDLTVESEIQEGDSITIKSDFSILNQGTYKLIRRFKNSFYIDNPNSIEEEITLADQLVSLGADSSTDFNIEKLDGINKLYWAGAGAEPSLEDLRPGDILNIAGGGSGLGATNTVDQSVNQASAYYDPIANEFILQTDGGSNPPGGYNGGGTGNKPILGFEGFDGIAIADFPVIQADVELRSVAQYGLSFNVQLDLLGDGTLLKVATITRTLNALIDIYGKTGNAASVTSFDISTDTDQFYVIGNLPSYTGALAWTSNPVTLSDILVGGGDYNTGYPNCKIINTISTDGGLPPAPTVMRAITAQFGGSSNTAVAETAILQLSFDGVEWLPDAFSANNQGEFHIVDSGEKLQQITRYTQSRGIDITSGQYGFLYSTDDATPYAFWYNVDGAGGAPTLPGFTLIEIPVLDTDDASEVAIKKAAILNNTPYDLDFSAEVDGDDVIVTNVLAGPCTAGSNGNIDGEFSVEVLQIGRRNFVDYINVNGVSEFGLVAANSIEVHREAIQFKEYEGTIPGDIFTISDNFLGENNVGSYIVSEVLSDSEIIVIGNMESIDKTLLDANFNKVYVEEQSPYIGYKQIELIATNPSNLNNKSVIFTTSNQFQKIGEIGGVSMSAIGKLEFPTEIVKGVDSYKFHTGLIGEANRIVYGEPRDNTTYPGVAAAGAEIFIKAPLVRRIEVSIDVRVKTGVPFSTIVEEVRNSIAALINSNPVGQPIAISNIVSNVDAIVGVRAVAISSPQYDAQNDVIRINAGEKALVLDIIADILVSKID